ncbi:MAG: hypothetical protein LN414_06525 [Candidatus Thermoplasmatota archaeon]|nr:hypothetical protein [Candidatus Thermoplasmatota archaeon]
MMDIRRMLNVILLLGLLRSIIELSVGLIYIYLLRSIGHPIWEDSAKGLPVTTAMAILELLIISWVAATIATILFILLKDRLPTRSNPLKGMILYTALWIIYWVYGYLSPYVHLHLGIPYEDIFEALGLVLAIVYGILLGYLWDRTEPSEASPPPRF